MERYQVKFRVSAIVGVEISAGSDEEAREKAEQIMEKSKIFEKQLDYIDGFHELIGFDNLDAWAETQPNQ